MSRKKEETQHDDNTLVGGESNEQQQNDTRIYILLENPRKNNNLGPLLRCAVAFGVTQVVAVGYAQCSVEGSHGASKHIPIVAFPTAQQALQYLRQEAQCRSIIGITGLDCPSSHPIHDRTFQPGNTCFVISKKSLPERLTTLCDSLVYIPHITEDVPSSDLLDAPICLSIVLHHYTEWYGSFQERTFQGHKYQLQTQTYQHDQQKHQERKLQKERNDTHVMDTNTPSLMDTLFGESGDY